MWAQDVHMSALIGWRLTQYETDIYKPKDTENGKYEKTNKHAVHLQYVPHH